MRRRHFEALRPLCPVCRGQGRDSPLDVNTVITEDDGDLLEGVLGCAEPSCLREYPVLDGVPLLVADLRGFVAQGLGQIHARDDLSETLESILGDCCGPGSPFDATRQHLSSYAAGHYGDLDPEVPAEERARRGSIVDLLERALEHAGALPEGPRIDVGCAVGRTSFALAEGTGELVLGIDLNFSMLRTASRVLRSGVVRYPRRRVGVAYDRREYEVELAGAERVDFWACDAAALPFADASFAVAACLNVLDCVASPAELLSTLARVLSPGGKALVTSPYDWSPGATPIEAWIGGHSQRTSEAGRSEAVLRRLLTPGAHPAAVPGLQIVAEEVSIPWRVRMHERSTVEYEAHLLVVERRPEEGA